MTLRNQRNPEKVREMWRNNRKSGKRTPEQEKVLTSFVVKRAGVSRGVARENPEKRSAHIAAQSIPRPETCQRCGEPHRKLHRHHPDYTKPLLVEFLCPRCHMRLHKEIESAAQKERGAGTSGTPSISDDTTIRTTKTEQKARQAPRERSRHGGG